jgi:hypothetical protein
MAEFIMIPTATVLREQEAKQRADLRRARYEHKRPPRTNHHKIKPFCMWDGEGPRDAGYALFGNSLGLEICHPFLDAHECLNLITKTGEQYPDYAHISFGFNYDVSMILGKLPFRHLTALHDFNKTIWEGWELEHIPHKWFRVKRGGVVVKIFDIRSFFAGAYVPALRAFNVGTEQELAILEAEKARRSEFLWSEIEEIREYFRLELKLGPLLGEKLRETFSAAGYNLQSWHGPGALARMALRRHKVYHAMAESPPPVKDAARYAFAGGRFEMVQAGHAQEPIFNADIHSAYPAFATGLPNLARGQWRHGREYEPGKFAVYHIRYESKPDPFRLFPLFRRLADSTVVWPYRVEGWYWAPEAELVAGDREAVFIESWVFDEDDSTDRPFAWLGEYYRRRQLLKEVGNAAEYTYKLVINSVYGQLAQRTGWDRVRLRPPRSHQLEWAGYITSACRASVYRAGRECNSLLVSVDTDGIYTTSRPPEVPVGEALGEWELSRYDDGIFWQSGIYMLKRGDEWVKAKTRGIPKGSYTAEDLLEAIRQDQPLRLTKKVFVTYGLAQSRPDELNTWVDEPHEFAFGGKGKRLHWPRACARVCGKLHRLGIPQVLFGPDQDCKSYPHFLPWLANDPAMLSQKEIMDSVSVFDANHLSQGDEWVRSYGNPRENLLDCP